ncbi:hypothetical protein DIZ76_015695 [Coccidioides immitis]|nr:hypothetical protein DIZ76_015695 [Coccidioides immitis]
MAETAMTKAGEARQPNNGVSGGVTRSTLTEDDAVKAKESAAAKDSQASSAPAEGATVPASASPKKRRKVNHACVYCRRSHMTCDSERPCTRCIKRNIGHLCHDEPRETSRRAKGEQDIQSVEEDGGKANNDFGNNQKMNRKLSGSSINDQLLGDGSIALQSQGGQDISTAAGQVNQQQLLGYNDWPFGLQNQFQDMHTFHPSYMFNAPEVTNEYNLLNDFLSTSLLDESAMYQGDDTPGLYSDMAFMNTMGTNLPGSGPFVQPQQAQQSSMAPPQYLTTSQSQAAQGNAIQRPNSTVGNDKAKETYYMTAADPSGTDPPEERMNKLLKAKYDAGLLKPFNYVNGYARLNKYMEEHLQPASRQKILRQLDKFRPKFRERMQSLTDIELVLVEMWFERSLMEYDRVFASMAIPACCWRRTGQIFRGNKEMAQLIDVPIESLRDGKLAIHEIIVEDQLVSYWEKFGAIAFDSSQKAMLTSCTLKSPDPKSPKQGIQCCFSFTIRRDPHNIPSIIVGNFLPTKRTDR